MKNILLVTSLATALGALSAPTATQAASAVSSPITVSLPVNSPTCTVANSSNTITLPPATAGQTIAAYQALNLPNSGVMPSATNSYSSPNLTQTTIITCSTANTPILGFLVAPGPNAVLASPYSQYLVDANTPTPTKVANGTNAIFQNWTEQLTVNGANAFFGYNGTYTTAFSTGALNTAPTPVSTATVTWHPIFDAPQTTSANYKFASPVGGSYNGSYLITVTY